MANTDKLEPSNANSCVKPHRCVTYCRLFTLDLIYTCCQPTYVLQCQTQTGVHLHTDHPSQQGIIAQTWVSLPRWKYNIHAFHIFPHILMTQSLAESHGYFFKMFSRRILNCCWIEISTAVLARNMSLELLFLASRVCVRTQFCHVARGPCLRYSFHNEVTRGGANRFWKTWGRVNIWLCWWP